MKPRIVLVVIALVGTVATFLVDQTYRVQIAREQEAFLASELANVELILADEARHLGEDAETLAAVVVASDDYPAAETLVHFLTMSFQAGAPELRHSIVDRNNIVQFDYATGASAPNVDRDLSSRPAAGYIAAAHRLGRTIVSDPLIAEDGDLRVHAFAPYQRPGHEPETIMVSLPLASALEAVAPNSDPPVALRVLTPDGREAWSNGPMHESVTRPLLIGDGRWHLSVGWVEPQGPPAMGIALVWLLGGLLTSLIVALIYLEQNRSQGLETAVAERTGELSEVNTALTGEIERRRQSESALQRERDRLSRIMETTPVGVLLLAADGQIRFANQRAGELLQLTPEDESSPFDIPVWRVTAGDAEPTADAPSFSRLLATNEPIHNARYALARSDGRRLLLSVNSAPLRDHDGQLVEVICTIEDVSDVVIAERELRESEERYRSLVEQAVVGIMTTDAAGNIIALNPWLVEKLGHPAERLLAMRIHDLLPATEKADMALRWQELLQGATVSSERNLVRADGSQWPIDISARRLDDGRFQVIIGDASDRHLAATIERRRREQLEALRAIGLELASQLEQTTLLDSIVNHAINLLAGQAGCLYLYRPDRDLLEVVVAAADTAVPIGHTLKIGEGLSGHVWKVRETLVVEDYSGWLGKSEAQFSARRRSVIAAPIFWGDTFIGVINVASDLPNVYGEEDARLLDLFASQAAVATQNARLYQAEQRARQSSEILRLANVSFSRTLDLSEVVGTLLDCLNHLIPYDRAGIILQSTNGEWELIASRAEDVTPPDFSSRNTFDAEDFPYLAHALNRTIRLDDSETVDRWRPLPGLEDARSWLSVPLHARGETLGFCYAATATVAAFPVDAVPLAESLGVQGAVAIQNIRLFDSEHNQRVLAEALRSAAVAFNQSRTLDDVLVALLKHAGQVIAHDAGDIMTIDESGLARVVRITGASDRPSMATRFDTLALPVDETPDLNEMATTGGPMIIADTDQYAAWVKQPATAWIRSAVAAPLCRNDEVLGFVHLYSARPNAFEPYQAQQLQAIVDQAAVALEKVHLYQDLQNYAEELESRVRERTRDLTVANRRLTELDRLKTKLIDDISHGLRTPLANLHLYLDLLDHGPAHKHAYYLTVIKQHTERLAALVKGVLELSQLAVETESLIAQSLDFNVLVARVVQSYEEQATKAGLSLTFSPGEALPPLKGDEARLAKMVDHLLSNAVNYTGDGGVAIETRVENGHVLLSVQDTGMGIEESDRPHIFDRFYRGVAANERNVSGIGLGLSLVSEIVALHNGEIEIHSGDDGGTTVFVRLPEK